MADHTAIDPETALAAASVIGDLGAIAAAAPPATGPVRRARAAFERAFTAGDEGAWGEAVCASLAVLGAAAGVDDRTARAALARLAGFVAENSDLAGVPA
jgi:hypothetical protein